jgi:DNA modification methylase
MNTSSLSTILGSALLGFIGKIGSPYRNYNIFNTQIALPERFTQTNKGLSDGSLNGVELCGDSLKLWRFLKEKSIQTIITSPPYFSMRDYSNSNLEIGKHKSLPSAVKGEEYVNQLVQLFLNLKDKIKDKGTIVVNIDVGAPKWCNHINHIPSLFASKMVETGEFLLDQEFTVYKENYRYDWNSQSRANPKTERIFVFTKSDKYKAKKRRPIHKKYNQLWTNEEVPKTISRVLFSKRANIKGWQSRRRAGYETFVERFPNNIDLAERLEASNFNHPAPMNKMLCWKLIQLFSDKGDVVLDPFSGAGNTTKAAKMCGRIGIGFELNKVYSMTAVVGEEWVESHLRNASKTWLKSNPKKPKSNKTLVKIPYCDPKKYDSKKTEWIDLSYLNLS